MPTGRPLERSPLAASESLPRRRVEPGIAAITRDVVGDLVESCRDPVRLATGNVGWVVNHTGESYSVSIPSTGHLKNFQTKKK